MYRKKDGKKEKKKKRKEWEKFFLFLLFLLTPNKYKKKSPKYTEKRINSYRLKKSKLN